MSFITLEPGGSNPPTEQQKAHIRAALGLVAEVNGHLGGTPTAATPPNDAAGLEIANAAFVRTLLAAAESERPRNEYSGTQPPGAGNDNTQGYGPGSVWVDTVAKEAYHCVDATAGAAVWIEGTLSVTEVAAMLSYKLDATEAALADLMEGDPELLRAALGVVEDPSDEGAGGLLVGSNGVTIAGVDGAARLSAGDQYFLLSWKVETTPETPEREFWFFENHTPNVGSYPIFQFNGTANRIFTFQDKSGTVAHLSDCEITGEVLISAPDAVVIDSTHMGKRLRNVSGATRSLVLGSATGDMVGKSFVLDARLNGYSISSNPPVGPNGTVSSIPAGGMYLIRDVAGVWWISGLTTSQVMLLTGDQTVAGAKTYTSPITSTGTPTLGTHVLNRDQADARYDNQLSGEVIVEDYETLLEAIHMGAVLRNLGSPKTLILGAPTGGTAGKTFAVVGSWAFSGNQPQGPVGTVTSVPGGTHIIRAIGTDWVIQTVTANQFIPASQNGDLTVEVVPTGAYTLTNADKGKMLVFDEETNLFATVADLAAVFNVGILARGGAVTLVVTGDLNGVTMGTGVIPQGYEPTSIFKAVSELVATGSIGAITEFTP